MATVQLTLQAARQLARAREWWLANREKAPRAFDDDMNALLLLLEERPTLVGRPLEQERAVRRVHLQRIRYYVYFQVDGDGEHVQILALWHASRVGEPTF
jgi:plasmid stabilization system protein ParE